jgi:hypothetical protein
MGVVPQYLATVGHVDEEWLAEARQAQQRLIHAEQKPTLPGLHPPRRAAPGLHGEQPQDVAAWGSPTGTGEMAHKADDSLGLAGGAHRRRGQFRRRSLVDHRSVRVRSSSSSAAATRHFAPRLRVAVATAGCGCEGVALGNRVVAVLAARRRPRR